jgi:Tfp pilus assembly protein PilF
MRADAKFDEGMEALRRGRFDDAREAWEEALKHDPDNRRVKTNLRKLKEKLEGEPGR